MDLAAETIDLGFHCATAELFDDGLSIGQPFRKHHRNWIAQGNLESRELSNAASFESAQYEADVGSNVIGTLDRCSDPLRVRICARGGFNQRRYADTQSQASQNKAYDVARAAGRGPE